MERKEREAFTRRTLLLARKYAKAAGAPNHKVRSLAVRILCSTHGQGVGGRYHVGPNRVVLKLGAHGYTSAQFHEILLHEVCHILHRGHPEEFTARVVRTARALWGVDIEGWTKVPRGAHKCRAYAVDVWLWEKLAGVDFGQASP